MSVFYTNFSDVVGYMPDCTETYIIDLIKQFGGLLGNVARVDAINGNDATAVIGGLPFKTVQGAIAAIGGSTGIAVWILPGTYTLPSTGITIPAQTALRGLSLQTCTLQITGATADTTMITMGENCRIEDLTINLSSSGHHTLVGMEFPGTSSVTSKLRTCVVSVDNSGATSTGTSNVYGILASGTGTLASASFSFNCLKGSTINVKSNGGGNKRGIFVNNNNIVTTRDLNVYVAPPTNVTSTGSYVGCEVNDASIEKTGSVQLRSTTLGTKTPVAATGPSGTIEAYTSADILQTTPSIILNPSYLASSGIQVGPGSDLVTKTAGGKGFSTYVYPTTIYYGLKGNLTSGTTAGWLWPGTQAVSAGTFPDPSGTDGNIVFTVTGCATGSSPPYQITTTTNTTVLGLSSGMPIVFSDNYGYIKEGAVVGTPAISPYYIFDVQGPNSIRIGTYVGGVLSVFNPGTYNSSQTIAAVYTKTVTATSYSSSTITLSSVSGLSAGMPIVFQSAIGTTVTPGTVYYILNPQGNTIPISATYNGPILSLSPGGPLSPNVIGNVVTISSAPAYYRIQQPAILSGMAAFLARPADTTGSGATTTITVYRTPVGSDYQFGLCPVANFTKTFSGTTLLETYYNSSKTFSAGDRIHVFLSYTTGSGTNSSHDLTVQLDMF